MKNKILEVLDFARNNAINLQDVYKRCGYSNYSYDDFLDIIDELKKEKLIYCVGGDSYTLNPFKEGIFHIKRNGDCYVRISEKDVSIPKEYCVSCLEGDKVLIRITDFNTYTGTVKEIIERKGIIAEVVTLDKIRYAKVKDKLYKIDLENNIVDGMLIGIKVDKNKSGKYFHATLDRIIGHKNAPKIEEGKILYEQGFPALFSFEAMEEAKNMQTEVSNDDFNGRVDLRNKIIFTIDGDDTKDIDDAISIDILDNGNYLLGVHIADVSHYVKENSHLDLEARERGTSVYMPGIVSPMYPPELSNGICSLNPDVDRLALSCDMEIDKQGALKDFKIYKSIIHSRKQMTYKNVNKILEENEVPQGYEEYADIIRNMKILADILRKSRVRRGMLNFDSPEIKILVDSNNKVLGIEQRYQGAGEILIEDFMLAANETVATYVYNMGLNFIYRVHDLPNEERLKSKLSVIKSYGFNIKTKINTADPKVIQSILSEFENTENDEIFTNMILRCMAKASYMTTNYGHFGIGVDSRKREAYTHFTSPIRRYPDSMVHRILTYILNGNTQKIESDEYAMFLKEIALHSSEMEIAADNCEREADKMRMAEYMKQFEKQKFTGKIMGFTKHGMFVRLDNFVEGRVGFETMDDYYNYNEELEIIVGERSKKTYRLGDKVDIIIDRCDSEQREIDFVLVRKKKKNIGDKNGNTK